MSPDGEVVDLKTCVVCGQGLTGRQQKYCGATCKKRMQRHPERYTKNKRGTTQKSEKYQVKLSIGAKTGDAKKAYEALRDRLAAEIDDLTDPKLLPVLADRFLETVDRLATINQVQKKGSALDDLKERRNRRTKRNTS